MPLAARHSWPLAVADGVASVWRGSLEIADLKARSAGWSVISGGRDAAIRHWIGMSWMKKDGRQIGVRIKQQRFVIFIEKVGRSHN